MLSQLRKLETVAANAARAAKGSPDVVMALSTVGKRYDELTLRAAKAPTATLGQRLYAARRRAELTAEETANAAGVSRLRLHQASAQSVSVNDGVSAATLVPLRCER